LNIILRGRWVRSYPGYYLGLVEDDHHGILENSPKLHHFTMREEELFKVGVVLRSSSIKVSKVGLRMLPLSRSNPLLLEFPLFMLDVLEVVKCNTHFYKNKILST
jgi:hypothetical protein